MMNVRIFQSEINNGWRSLLSTLKLELANDKWAMFVVTLKVPITTTADAILIFLDIFFLE